MPTNLVESYDTTDLVQMLQGTYGGIVPTGATAEVIGDELAARIVTEDNEYKGGIHPTHPL